jgi:hypothetical protein
VNPLSTSTFALYNPAILLINLNLAVSAVRAAALHCHHTMALRDAETGSSNGQANTSETSPLLANGDGKSNNGTLTIIPSDPIEEIVPSSSNGNGKIEDEEAAVDQVANPLMEGLPEVAAKMHMLLPAVGIGVCREGLLFKKLM